MARKKRRQERDFQAENRKQILRERKERRERQMLLAVLGPVLAVALGIFAYGGLRDLYIKPHRPVARVEGQTITVAQFTPRLQWYRRQMLNNLQSFMQFASTSDPSFLVNLAEQQRQGAPEVTVDQMIDEVLIRNEAQQRGIQVTEADIDERIRNDLATLIAPPTTEALAAVEAVTDTAGTASPTTAIAATATAISTQRIGEEFRLTLQPVLDQVGMSVAGYREIVRHALYREKLGENMVPVVQKQIEAAYMRFASEATAQQAADALAAGADWDAVVAQFQEPTETPETPPAEAGGEVAPEGVTSGAPTTDAGDAAELAGSAAEESVEVEAAQAISTETPEVPLPSASPTQLAPTATRPAAATTPKAPATPTAAEPGTTADAGPAETNAAGTEPSAAAARTGSPVALTTATPANSPTPTILPTPTATPEPYASEVGERSWLTRFDIIQQWSLADEDADAVMAIAKGRSSGPHKATGNMWYVVYVFDRAEEREVPEERLQSLRDQAVNDWVNKRKEEVKPDKYTLEGVIPEEPLWFVQAWERLFPPARPTATVQLGTLVVPTAVGETGDAPVIAATVMITATAAGQ